MKGFVTIVLVATLLLLALVAARPPGDSKPSSSSSSSRSSSSSSSSRSSSSSKSSGPSSSSRASVGRHSSSGGNIPSGAAARASYTRPSGTPAASVGRHSSSNGRIPSGSVARASYTRPSTSAPSRSSAPKPAPLSSVGRQSSRYGYTPSGWAARTTYASPAVRAETAKVREWLATSNKIRANSNQVAVSEALRDLVGKKQAEVEANSGWFGNKGKAAAAAANAKAAEAFANAVRASGIKDPHKVAEMIREYNLDTITRGAAAQNGLALNPERIRDYAMSLEYADEIRAARSDQRAKAVEANSAYARTHTPQEVRARINEMDKAYFTRQETARMAHLDRMKMNGAAASFALDDWVKAKENEVRWYDSPWSSATKEKKAEIEAAKAYVAEQRAAVAANPGSYLDYSRVRPATQNWDKQWEMRNERMVQMPEGWMSEDNDSDDDSDSDFEDDEEYEDEDFDFEVDFDELDEPEENDFDFDMEFEDDDVMDFDFDEFDELEEDGFDFDDEFFDDEEEFNY